MGVPPDAPMGHMGPEMPPVMNGKQYTLDTNILIRSGIVKRCVLNGIYHRHIMIITPVLRLLVFTLL